MKGCFYASLWQNNGKEMIKTREKMTYFLHYIHTQKEGDQKVVILFFLFGGGYESVVKYSILRQGSRPF